MLTNGKIRKTRFTSEDGNPFAALAQEIRRADREKAANLARTRPMREANARKRSQKDS